jgi:hypothetical protein
VPLHEMLAGVGFGDRRCLFPSRPVDNCNDNFNVTVHLPPASVIFLQHSLQAKKTVHPSGVADPFRTRLVEHSSASEDLHHRAAQGARHATLLARSDLP